MSKLLGTLILIGATSSVIVAGERDIESLVTHHYAQNGDVRLHYVSAGEGPLVLMLHGFPDYWYTWRHQIETLSQTNRVVAMDLRGYNLSDQPDDVSDYVMTALISDVIAVMDHAGEKSAVLVGNDWGGAIAWFLTAFEPRRVDGLIVCNLPHPACFARELRNNPAQRAASAYARAFTEEGSEAHITPAQLVERVAGTRSERVRADYLAALTRSSTTAMMNYYRASFPKSEGPSVLQLFVIPKIKVPTLVVHGMKDPALLPGALSGTWEHIDNELTIVTLPKAGHFVQQDAADQVSRLMSDWIGRLQENVPKAP